MKTTHQSSDKHHIKESFYVYICVCEEERRGVSERKTSAVEVGEGRECFSPCPGV